MELLGRLKIILRSDNDASIKKLRSMIIEGRQKETKEKKRTLGKRGETMENETCKKTRHQK